MAITLLHFAFITKYVAHFVAQSLLFSAVAITRFWKNYPIGPFSQVLSHIWLLGKFVNSSCDIKINVSIVQNCCRSLPVRGLIYSLLYIFSCILSSPSSILSSIFYSLLFFLFTLLSFLSILYSLFSPLP